MYVFLRVHSPGHTFIYFLAQIWHVALQGPSNDHLHIRFFIRHIVSPWWHIGGFSETTHMKFKIELN